MVSPSSLKLPAITYSPYGFQDGLRPTGILYFAGERLDSAGHGYLLGNGYRLYLPALLRFASADDISPFGDGGLNAYAYCAGDPINRQDPSGHMSTGLTALLKGFGLRKKDLKFHLRGLAKPETKGSSMFVKKLEGDQFITYRFTGDSPRITGEQLPFVESRAQTAGVFFRKGNIHIPSPHFDHPGKHLIRRGYERVELNSETHAFIHVGQQSAGPVAALNRELPGISPRPRAEPNIYVDVDVVRRS